VQLNFCPNSIVLSPIRSFLAVKLLLSPFALTS